MNLGLEGKVAFITGGSKGIGKECARVLSEEGATVVITARGQELLEQTT
jgi:3-oxoacyl-[acyl-carrier protein] reductase